MEKKGLRVNAGKTKVMICGTGLDLLLSSGEYPCAVCRTGVGNNSIYCNGCKLWVHKKCSGLQRLTPNPDYMCARCMGNASPIDSRPLSEFQVQPDKLEVVASFCYLVDMVSAGGGCEITVTTCVKTAWKKFRELLGQKKKGVFTVCRPTLFYSCFIGTAQAGPENGLVFFFIFTEKIVGSAIQYKCISNYINKFVLYCRTYYFFCENKKKTRLFSGPA